MIIDGDRPHLFARLNHGKKPNTVNMKALSKEIYKVLGHANESCYEF